MAAAAHHFVAKIRAASRARIAAAMVAAVAEISVAFEVVVAAEDVPLAWRSDLKDVAEAVLAVASLLAAVSAFPKVRRISADRAGAGSASRAIRQICVGFFDRGWGRVAGGSKRRRCRSWGAGALIWPRENPRLERRVVPDYRSETRPLAKPSMSPELARE